MPLGGSLDAGAKPPVAEVRNLRPRPLARLLIWCGTAGLLAGLTCAYAPKGLWLLMGISGLVLVLGLLFWTGILNSNVSRRLEVQLGETVGDLGSFFDLLPLGAFVSDSQGRVFQCNRRALELLGMDKAALQGINWRDPEIPLVQIDGNPTPRDQMPFNTAIATGERSSATLGIERPLDGDWIWLQMSVEPRLDGDGQVKDLFCTFEDVSERRSAEAELALQTFRDRLTSLPNRTLFMEHLTQALLRAERRHATAAVLFLDMDRFKMVNDSLSHEAGDQLLIQVAKRIRGCLRPEDTVARLSGDEFAVLFEDFHSVNDGVRVAERIRAALEPSFQVGGQEIYATCSMGLAASSASSLVPSELLRDAEVAMYRAKAREGGAIEIFDPSMNAQALVRFQLESDLRRALDRGEFMLFYQPLVSLKTGQIDGWEALVRWKHPERGMISPVHFIPVAEETGLIVPLGRWVLEESVRQASLWRVKFPSDPPRLISVNISGRQFQQQDLVNTVTEALDSSHFDPRCLKLEITESVMMRDPKTSLEAMNSLRNLDIHLVVDDFGTGYSSLSYLKRFPVDTLKVDKSFVDGLGKDSESTAIVKAVISLAKSLGMRVTAEGIETEDQLARLRALECDQGQGYFFSRPVPAAEAERLLVEGRTW